MRGLFAAVAAAACVALVACGGDSDPESVATPADFERALAGAQPPLSELYSQAGEILPGGPRAFRRRVASLRGHPLVVNKWASWCGPCRFEFPFFQAQALRRGKRVAFLGVDSRDARSDAREFLRELPVPYPSYFDPEGEIAEVFRGERVFPATAFYDRRGELVFTKQGGYASEEALADDVARYAC